MKEIQTFETTNISWTLVELKRGQLALIALNPTEQYLTLYGKKGAENSKKVLNTICKIWSSYKLGLDAKCISPTDYKELPKSIKELLINVWIDENVSIKENGEFKDMVYFVNKQAHYGKYSLSSQKTGERALYAGIRPIVYLPNNILIEVSTKILYKDYNDASKMKLENIIGRLETNTEVTKETIDELLEVLNNM